MEQLIRRSSREVKIKKDSDFEYDDEVFAALTGANKSSASESERAKVQSGSVKSLLGWTEFELAHLGASSSVAVEETVENVIEQSDLTVFLNQSQSQSQFELTTGERPAGAVSNVNSAENLGRRNLSTNLERRTSSTRLDFLGSPFMDLEGNFLKANSITSMSASESEADNGVNVLEGETAGGSGTGRASEKKSEETLMESLLKVLDKKFSSIEKTLVKTNKRLDKLEEGSVSGSVRGSVKGSSSESESKGKGPKKSKKKKDRVEFAKDRSLVVSLEKLVQRAKETRTETEEDTEDTEETEDEELNLKSLKNGMSKKKKEESRMRAAKRLQQAGGAFPVGGSDTTSSGSGNESDDESDSRRSRKSRKSRNKVKSGATVKQRSVVKTELWPHTIANEEDGEDTTSESISLAKFLSCFTYIMTTCERRESKGRQVLLLALASMLEDLPWKEVRTFHNLVMTKLEQDRIDWKSDFTDLADQHVNKKVRQLLRNRGQPTGTNSIKAAFQSSGKGFSPNYRSSDIRNKVVYSTVCKSWNEGSCTFGVKCKRWHVCSSCGQAGRLGEPHKSSSQECPIPRNRNDQRR